MSKSQVIEAAGGLVWRNTPDGKQILLVHRQRYDDWTLPKGKLEDGEAWEQAAFREIEEETGYKAELGKFAGSTTYVVGKAPKIVLFWHMDVEKEIDFVPNEEVDKLLWLSFEKALDKLSYDSERELLAQHKP